MCLKKCKKEVNKQMPVSTEEKLQENFNESTEFYTMVKKHANSTFTMAVISLAVGLIICVFGSARVIFCKDDVGTLTVVAGVLTEFISASVFWLHRKTVAQLNEFHKRLNSTERYLTSIMLAERLPEEEKNLAYRWILENCILTDVEIQTGHMMEWRHGKGKE